MPAESLDCSPFATASDLLFRWDSSYRFQTFAETHDIVHLESHSLVELNDFRVCTSHLKIDLRAACRPEKRLCFIHQSCRDPGPPVLWMNGKIVDPAAVAIVPGHHGTDELIVQARHEKHLRLHLEFPLDVSMRIIPGNDQTTIDPQLGNEFFIANLKRSDFHVHLP